MFPKQQIDGFEKYWRRRKPGSSTAVQCASDCPPPQAHFRQPDANSWHASDLSTTLPGP